MYMMASWYTDLMDIYRVGNTVTDGITTQDLSLIASGVPCRVYSNQTNNWNGRATEATVRADEKLSCDINTDVREGDTLYITRGGALGRGLAPVRYIASKPVAYFDPVGGAMTGLEHLQVGLHADNIAG